MWATSVGFIRSHRPVPGERKSGIPDGTEMPAPVSATTEPASRISAASCSRAGPGTARPRSGVRCPPAIASAPGTLSCP